MREARALPTRLTRDEAFDLQLRRERLVAREGSGERPMTRTDVDEGGYTIGFYDGGVFEEDSWDAWREDYDEATS